MGEDVWAGEGAGEGDEVVGAKVVGAAVGDSVGNGVSNIESSEQGESLQAPDSRVNGHTVPPCKACSMTMRARDAVPPAAKKTDTIEI